MPISNARPPKTQEEKDKLLDKDYLRRKNSIGPHVESCMILNGSVIHEWTDDGALKYKVGNTVEIDGRKYKIKIVEREIEGNKLFRRYTLNQDG
jgi:hypothetical protein